jgi:DNA-binding LacI/PurR family transcriptional regulator
LGNFHVVNGIMSRKLPTRGASGIRDVAKAAGVSMATASRVLAKADYPVASETRQRVLEAARKVGFVPNALARGLVRSRTDTLGVVVPGIINPYYAAMVEAIDRASRRHGFTTLLGLTGGDEERREQIIDELLGRRVDGLIVCAGADDHVEGRTPHTLSVPAILIGEQPNAGFPIIRTDNHRAGYEATRYLWSLGHRSFVYLTSLDSWHDFHRRGQGMRAFLETRDEAYEVEMFDGLFGEADAYDRVKRACEGGFPATAVLASTDRHALGTLAAFADAGLDVPGDLSVMGFDDYVTSGFIRPALTTMQMPAAEMGERAVALLSARFAGTAVEPTTLLEATLVERASSGPAPALRQAARGPAKES